MIAVCKKDDYPDLVPGAIYVVDHFVDKYVILRDNPRRYVASNFKFFLHGKKIPISEARLFIENE